MMAHAIKRECDAEFLMHHHHMSTTATSSSSSPTQVQQHHLQQQSQHQQQQHPSNATKMGSRRIFTAQFKLQVLDSYRNDGDCKGNQRATARKYGIHRRQIQKWLQCESNLRKTVLNGADSSHSNNHSNNNNNHTKPSAINEIQSDLNGIVELSLAAAAAGRAASSPLQFAAFSHHHHRMPLAAATAITGCRFSPAVDRHTPVVVAEPATTTTTSTSLPVSATVHHHHHHHQQQQHHDDRCAAPFFVAGAAHDFTNDNVGSAAAAAAARPIVSDRLHQQQQQHAQPQRSAEAPFHYLAKPAAARPFVWPHTTTTTTTATHHQQTFNLRRDDGASCDDVSLNHNSNNNNHCDDERVSATTEIPTTPIDLSVHSRGAIITPPPPFASRRFDAPVPRPHAAADSGAWDLSASDRKRKCNDEDDDAQRLPTPPKVVKLFKPYLMSDEDAAAAELDATPTTAFKPIARRQHDPIIWSNFAGQQPLGHSSPAAASASSSSHHSFDANNNNHHHHRSPFFPCSSVSPALSSTTVGSTSPALAYTSPAIHHHHFSHGSPVSGYDTASSSYSTAGSDCGADDRHSLSSRCSSVGTASFPTAAEDAAAAAASAEYSLELKMHALDRMYSETAAAAAYGGDLRQRVGNH